MSLANLVNYHIETNGAKYVSRHGSCPMRVHDTTASHSHHLALMCIDTIRKLKLSVNPLYTIELALRHDICEIGNSSDIDSLSVERGIVTLEQKKELERKTINRLSKQYQACDEIFWREYEEGKTPESRFVKAMDKIECLIHIIERGGTGRTWEDNDRNHVAKYADEATRNFIQLEPLLKEVKLRLKKVYSDLKFPWEPEYNYPGL
ncbi:MAG: HD domain-containing protein [Nanoarchaeota archaeon]|nr:HD domain-containing protein [Nanoarchaeota archaeon]